MSHGVRLLRRAFWTVGVVDEEIRPARVLGDLPGRSSVYGVDSDGASLGDAEAYALKTVVKREGCNLGLAYLRRLPRDQLAPAEAFAKPALCARKRQVEEVSQRTERVERGVNEKRGLREGRQGGEQGSEPADVVEMTVTKEQVAHALQRNPGGLQATEQHGAAGGVDQHRLLARERQSQARLRPLAVKGVAGTEEGQTSQAGLSRALQPISFVHGGSSTRGWIIAHVRLAYNTRSRRTRANHPAQRRNPEAVHEPPLSANRFQRCYKLPHYLYKGRIQGLQSYGIWKVALGPGTQRHEERIGFRSRRIRPRRDRVAAEPEDHTRHRCSLAESQRAGDEARRGDGETLRGRQRARREAWLRGSRPPDLLRRFDGKENERGDPVAPQAGRESWHRGARVGSSTKSARPCLPRWAHHSLARHNRGAGSPPALR